jgi:PAS domain S-box-containing protein
MSDDRDAGRPDEPGAEADAPGPSAEERYRKIFEYSNDAVVIVDFETEEFLEVNPAACDLLGYSREELRSMEPADIHPDDVERVREEFLTRVYEDGAGFTDDLTCLAKDGEEIPTEISGAALDPAADGAEPTQMVAMLRDVSERLRHRRELEAKIDRLDRFAGVVSHDLQSPLSVIRGRTRLARESGDLDHLDAIADAVDRMDRMLTELLHLTREGKVIGERTAVDLETLARRAWERVEADAARLEVASSRTIEVDRDRAEELFENLFGNAVDHAGPAVTVRVGTIETADVTGFYVEDTGEGIPPGERESVFEWGHTSAAEGTGFGLAIVAEIVDAHGWEIRATESAAGGARFEITRP